MPMAAGSSGGMKWKLPKSVRTEFGATKTNHQSLAQARGSPRKTETVVQAVVAEERQRMEMGFETLSAVNETGSFDATQIETAMEGPDGREGNGINNPFVVCAFVSTFFRV